MLKVFVLALAVFSLMVAIKDGGLLREAGLLGSCTTVAAPPGSSGYWQACRPGRLEGRPDLSRRSCERQGTARGIEFWRCPAEIGNASKND
ncbi:MAG: hypothetical protein M3303_01270 [Gemmatimonadota bacterium]|nr:hypothetical protein [Gemmatimonadota bacterium]